MTRTIYADPAVARFVQRLLAGLTYEITGSHNACEAVELLDQNLKQFVAFCPSAHFRWF